MTRTEFWRMHPIELWWLLDAHKPQKMYGDIPESVIAEMYEDAYGWHEAEDD